MKILFYSLFVGLCAIAPQVYAAAPGGGYDHGNGGDMCENAFKMVRDSISTWITKDGAKGLLLPPKISYEKYKHDMLEKIQTAKVSCVDEKLFVGRAEKTCKNFVEADGSSRILCNTNRFLATLNLDQYVLVHHEYAGLAGFEVNTGENSHYEISNQIIRGVIDIRIAAVKSTMLFIEKVLKSPERTSLDHAKKNNSICMYIGRINGGDTTVELYRQLIALDIHTTSELLRLNIRGMMNYCVENLVEEDPNLIHFEDAPALLARIADIQLQLSDIENYLDQIFPYRGNF